MFAILFQKIEQLSGAAQSYTAAGFGLLTQLDPMQIGAALLLIIRIIVDAPRAYRTVRDLFKKD